MSGVALLIRIGCRLSDEESKGIAGARRGREMSLSSGRCPALELALAVLLLVPVCALALARAGDSADTSSLDSPVDTETIRLPVVDGKDIHPHESGYVDQLQRGRTVDAPLKWFPCVVNPGRAAGIELSLKNRGRVGRQYPMGIVKTVAVAKG